MPELPEVECLTRALRNVVEGGRILEARFLRPDLRDPIPSVRFKKIVVGQPIARVFRRSKYLLVETGRGFGIFHLGMTGNILYRPSGEPSEPHTHALFRVASRDGGAGWLHFVDPRRFGRIDCLEGADLNRHDSFAELGPEPLEEKELGRYLFDASRGRKQPVKSFLMDQRVLVGVGNIYASESLFKAGVLPARAAGQVARSGYDKLADAIRATLESAIAAGGTSFRDYRHADGEPGYFQVSLAVYDREGEPCRKCKRPIQAARHSGRSTYFCPRCQS